MWDYYNNIPKRIIQTDFLVEIDIGQTGTRIKSASKTDVVATQKMVQTLYGKGMRSLLTLTYYDHKPIFLFRILYGLPYKMESKWRQIICFFVDFVYIILTLLNILNIIYKCQYITIIKGRLVLNQKSQL